MPAANSAGVTRPSYITTSATPPGATRVLWTGLAVMAALAARIAKLACTLGKTGAEKSGGTLPNCTNSPVTVVKPGATFP